MIISASCLPCGEMACAAEAKPLLCFAQVSALISSQLLFGPRGMNRVSARHGRTPREMTKRQADELVGILVTRPFHPLTGRRANVMPLRAELKHSSGITVVSSNIEMTVGTPRSLPICRFRDVIWSSRTVFGALHVHGLQQEGSLKISCLHQPRLMQAKGNVFSTSQSLYHSLSISVVPKSTILKAGRSDRDGVAESSQDR